MPYAQVEDLNLSVIQFSKQGSPQAEAYKRFLHRMADDALAMEAAGIQLDGYDPRQKSGEERNTLETFWSVVLTLKERSPGEYREIVGGKADFDKLGSFLPEIKKFRGVELNNYFGDGIAALVSAYNARLPAGFEALSREENDSLGAALSEIFTRKLTDREAEQTPQFLEQQRRRMERERREHNEKQWKTLLEGLEELELQAREQRERLEREQEERERDEQERKRRAEPPPEQQAPVRKAKAEAALREALSGGMDRMFERCMGVRREDDLAGRLEKRSQAFGNLVRAAWSVKRGLNDGKDVRDTKRQAAKRACLAYISGKEKVRFTESGRSSFELALFTLSAVADRNDPEVIAAVERINRARGVSDKPQHKDYVNLENYDVSRAAPVMFGWELENEIKGRLGGCAARLRQKPAPEEADRLKAEQERYALELMALRATNAPNQPVDREKLAATTDRLMENRELRNFLSSNPDLAKSRELQQQVVSGFLRTGTLPTVIRGTEKDIDEALRTGKKTVVNSPAGWNRIL